MRRIATLTVAIALMLMAPASAFASSSTCQAYNPETCPVQNGQQSSVSSGTLPFTGLDIVLLVAGGGVLLGAGFLVRRVSRNLS